MRENPLQDPWMEVVALLGERPPWQKLALCGQTDPEGFFPEREEGQAARIRLAIRICNRCPVKTRCLDWALEHDEQFGIWGGTSESERRQLKRHAA